MLRVFLVGLAFSSYLLAANLPPTPCGKELPYDARKVLFTKTKLEEMRKAAFGIAKANPKVTTASEALQIADAALTLAFQQIFFEDEAALKRFLVKSVRALLLSGEYKRIVSPYNLESGKANVQFSPQWNLISELVRELEPLAAEIAYLKYMAGFSSKEISIYLEESPEKINEQIEILLRTLQYKLNAKKN